MNWARWQRWMKTLPSRYRTAFARIPAAMARPFFRVVLLSAAIQVTLAVVLWHRLPKQALELNTAAPIALITSRPEVNTNQVPDMPESQPNAPMPESPLRHSSPSTQQRDPRAPTPYTSDAGAQPLTTNRPKQVPPHTSHAPTTSATHATASEPSPHLSPVAVPVVLLRFQLTLSDGSNTWAGPPTHYRVTHQKDHRFFISLATDAPQGQGIMNFRHFFQANDSGWYAGHSSGGITIKSAQSAKGHGINMPADFSQTHQDFLDRISLIAYVHGWLVSHPNFAPRTLQLPVYSYGGVQQREVKLAKTADSAHCRPCVRATVAHSLSEVNQLEVWYSGAVNWRPVEIRFQVNTQPKTYLHLHSMTAL